MKDREIFRALGLPVSQNRMFPTAEEALATPRGDVILVQDQKSGLVHNVAFDPGRLIYDQNYQNEQAHSQAFRKHLDIATKVVDRHFKGLPLVEIGCGKGFFLEHLQRHGFDIVGVDPAYEGSNPAVIAKEFDGTLGLLAEGIVLRHVLEHIPNPFGFLAKVASANCGKGKVYIEVPCFDWIREHRAWFDVFYEHVNYFRMRDFQRIFGTIYEIGHLFGGQYLYVVADLSSLRDPEFREDHPIEMPADFLAGINRTLSATRENGTRRNAIWGGASKGVIFSIYMLQAGLSIHEVIDINPAKQGLYLAGTGLRVFAPDQALHRMSKGDNIFVMNSIYLDEIVLQSGNQYTYVTLDHEKL